MTDGNTPNIQYKYCLRCEQELGRKRIIAQYPDPNLPHDGYYRFIRVVYCPECKAENDRVSKAAYESRARKVRGKYVSELEKRLAYLTELNSKQETTIKELQAALANAQTNRRMHTRLTAQREVSLNA